MLTIFSVLLKCSFFIIAFHLLQFIISAISTIQVQHPYAQSVFIWWLQLAVGPSLNCASCQGSWDERSCPRSTTAIHSVGVDGTHNLPVERWTLYYWAIATQSVFLLRYFVHWNISVICLTVVLDSLQQRSLPYIFRHSDQNDLIFVDHFKNISAYDQKKQVSNTCGILEVWMLT